MTRLEKKNALDAIANVIIDCQACKESTIGIAVPGEGNPNASVVFIGEAPGKQEAVEGRPFIGRSGKLLRKLIVGAGLKEEDVYITSPVKYLPARGTPTPAQIAHGRTHLMKQLEVIDPKIIVLLGRVAAEGVLQKKVAVATQHGSLFEENEKKYFLVYHPAAAVRFQKNMAPLVEDFRKLKDLL